MYRKLILSLAVVALTSQSALADGDYLGPYNTLTGSVGQNIYSKLKAGKYSIGYLNQSQIRATFYLAYPNAAKALLIKQHNNQPLSRVEVSSLSVINNISAVLASFPKLGQLGYNYGPDDLKGLSGMTR